MQYPANQMAPYGGNYQEQLAQLQQQAQAQLQQQYQNHLGRIQQQFNPMWQQGAQQMHQSAMPPMNCTHVSCIDEVRAAMVSPTGAPSLFYASGLDAFFKKQLMPNGLPDVAMYQRVQTPGQQPMQQPMQQEGSQDVQMDKESMMQQLQMMQQEIERLKGANANAGMGNAESDPSGTNATGSSARRGKSSESNG